MDVDGDGNPMEWTPVQLGTGAAPSGSSVLAVRGP